MEIFILIILALFNLLVVLAALLFIIWLVQSLIFKAPFIPLPKLVVEKVVELTTLAPKQTFFDLGSGDGRVIRAVAHHYPTAICIGVEKAILPNLLAAAQKLFDRTNNVVYIRKDFTKAKLNSADVVFLYLWPSVMSELSPKLKAELSLTAKIICCQFKLSGFKLVSTDSVAVDGTLYYFYTYKNSL
jgi:hypothetical protein